MNTHINDEERANVVRKLQEDVHDFVSNLKPKKYEDGWPEDKWEEEMEKHPIFMSKPVEEGQDMPPLVEAMQQLKYDPEFNSPKELAMSYKEDGNENFNKKKYHWAVESYTKALDFKCEDNVFNAVLYTNRATAQYYIGNYRKSLIDATEAKSLNPQYLKAIYRGARCCLQLKEYDNCVSWCNDGLELNDQDETLLDLLKKAEEGKVKDAFLKRKAASKLLKEKREVEALNKAIRERGICIEGENFTAKFLEPIYPEAASTKVNLTSEGTLIWPVILLYPEFGTTDFIREFNEETCFYDHFALMFNEPASWDTKNEYIAEKLQVYFTDKDSVLVPVDKMESLKSVMRHKRFILKSGTLSFCVTASNSEFDKSYRAKNC